MGNLNIRRKIRTIIRFAVFLIIFSAVFNYIYKVFERKDSIQKRKGFYEIEQDIDVLFLGTSLVIYGVFPMELWEDYGIAAYNFAGHAELLPVNYWVLENALKYTKPKLVIVDVYTIDYETKVYEADMSFVHSSLDSMPLSVTKINAVNDLIPNDYSKSEYLFDFELYHSRWEELEAKDFNYNMNVSNGASYNINVRPQASPVLIGGLEYSEVDNVSVEYLEKIINLCKKNDIECLLINIPFWNKLQRQTNYARCVANDNEVEFYNIMQTEECVFNYKTDFADGAHMNPSGGMKLTHYLGEYIKNNYDIPDRRTDSDYLEWNDLYETYLENEVIYNVVGWSPDLYNSLMFLYNNKFAYEMKIDNRNNILSDEMIINELNNLGILVEIQEGSSDDIYQISSDRLVVDYDVLSAVGEFKYDIEICCKLSNSGEVLYNRGYTKNELGKFISEVIEY